LIALLLLPGLLLENRSKPSWPQPTQHWLDEGAEFRNKKHRREYVDKMHRAAPDVDWKAVEKRNGLAAMARKMERIKNPAAMTTAVGTWRELGSRNLAGRMHCAAWSPDGQTLYAGSDRGGLWKGIRDGTGWTPLGDNLYGGVHEMAVLPGDGGGPDILIRLYGSEVHRTLDQGLTWEVPEGLTKINQAKRILVLEDADHTVFILTRGNLGKWKVKVSLDKGATFTTMYSLIKEGDIWTSRTALGPVYLVSGDKVYETSDQGQTWTALGNPIPVNYSRAILAGSENPDLRFNAAFLVNNTWELWRSEDAGVMWNYIRDLEDFWESLVASTQGANLIAYAGVEMFVSRDAGSTWKKVNNWGAYYGNPEKRLHADIPGLFVLPDPNAPKGEVWYIGTDGGLYHSLDWMWNVQNLSMSDLGVSQYYTVLTSRRNPDLVLAGSQDQGYQRSVLNGPPPPPPGPWADFDQLISGDYGHLTSSNGAHDLVYSVYPGFVLVQEGEDNPSLLYPWVDFPAGESHLWMPYILADPTDKEAFFFCATHLYRYERDSGATWNYVQHSSQDFSPGYLTSLAFSPLDPDRAWAATGDGRLYYSSDRGVNWTQSNQNGPGTHYFYGTVLLPSSTDKDTCWVAGSGYSTAPVWRTLDGGANWQPERNGLPGTLVYCMAEAPDQSGRLYCGTENGAWEYDPDTRLWSDILGTEGPINTYWTCEAVPSQNLIRFGTYGRGLWDYHLNTAGYFPYGELLGEPHVLELKNNAPPLIGKPTTFVIIGCQPDADGVLALSSASANVPAVGGTLLVQFPVVLLPFEADGTGTATISFSLPNSLGLVGQEFFYQAGAIDPTQVEGFSLSNGLRAVIGE
jgi:photosystem II stability/assembly factor-like uncharacterized protein